MRRTWYYTPTFRSHNSAETYSNTYQTSDDYFSTACSGIWGKNAIPGGSQPYIKGLYILLVLSYFLCDSTSRFIVTLENTSQGPLALLVYEWQDFDKIGKYNDLTGEVRAVIILCTSACSFACLKRKGVRYNMFVTRTPFHSTYAKLHNMVDSLYRKMKPKRTLSSLRHTISIVHILQIQQ